MKKYLYTSLIIIIALTAVMIIQSCSQSDPKVLPDPTSHIQIDTDSRTLTHQSEYMSDLVLLNYIVTMKMGMIELSCGFYADIHGQFPESLDVLLDGFMPFWPENPFLSGDGSPVQISNSVPDPKNPNDRGKIYYQRINDYEASLKYINVDYKNSDDKRMAFATVEKSIHSDWAEFAKSSQSEGWRTIGASLENMNFSERLETSYERTLSQALINMVFISTFIDGEFNKSFGSLLDSSGFYILDSGWINLLDRIDTGRNQFEIGVTTDGGWLYINFGPDSKMLSECYRFKPIDYVGNKIETSYDCFNTNSQKTVYINSNGLSNIEGLSDRFISKKDVVG